MRWKRILVTTPIIGRCLLMIPRLRIALPYLLVPCVRMLRWLWTSRESTNFTYHLTSDNLAYLAVVTAAATARPVAEIERYFMELQNNNELREHLIAATRRSPRNFLADNEIRYARRIGWYAFVRALKPKVVIETGVDKGLGSCVLAAALKRNAEEGHPGRYYGTDINPDAGYLFSGSYRQFGEIVYGDSIASLSAFTEQIDLFINDSDHSADYEAREYDTIVSKLSPDAVILGDNAHCNNRLLDFSSQQGRQFIFFREVTADHWYPGAGIGISYLPRKPG